MYFTPEAADGQFVIPVIDPHKLPRYTEILAALEERSVCAVLAGEERSLAYAQKPENLPDMFLNDDCAPVYGSWMVPEGECTPEYVAEAVWKEICRVHGFQIVPAQPDGAADPEAAQATGTEIRSIFGLAPRRMPALLSPRQAKGCAQICVASGNVRRSIILLSLRGVKFDWNTVRYGNRGVDSIYLERRLDGFAVYLMLSRNQYMV